MYTVRKYVEIDAGHRVPFHESKCCNLHGHRYRITAELRAPSLVDPSSRRSDSGMVMDFGMIKEILMQEIHDPFDHKMILWERDPLWDAEGFIHALERTGIAPIAVPCIPTAEELADYWATLFRAELQKRAEEIPIELTLASLEVRETPTSTATWYG